MSDSPISFNDFKLNKQLLDAVKEAGYETPSPVQQKTIPLINAGHDVLGIAPTGTGKTAAYVLPLLLKVKYAQGMYPRAFILAPTRELVMQISKEITHFAKYTDIRHVALYGGIGPKTQIEDIKKGVDILVSTPGRFLEIYRKEELFLKDIKTMVMDEADKMMDMGFMHQIRSILEVIPVKRQNLLFSATFSDKVERLSSEFLEFPIRAEVAPQATTAETISQRLYLVPNFKTKINLLEHLLLDEVLFQKVIIFTKTRIHADNIFKFLTRKGKGAVRVIHANKGQNTRINAMEEFKGGDIRVLVATDVASRGIDVSMVSHVINFDVPLIYEDYVHRIGRTGRASQLGEAITFANKAEIIHIEKIEKLIRKTIPVLEIPKEVKVEETPHDERQAIDRELDEIKRRNDPEFKGAFHEKKRQKPVEKPYKSNKKTDFKTKRRR